MEGAVLSGPPEPSNDPFGEEEKRWTPVVPDGGIVADVPLHEIIGQAIGTASMCWTPHPSGVFDSEKAEWVADGATECVQALINRGRKEALLGLASTRDILQELQTRGEISLLMVEGAAQEPYLRMREKAAHLLATLPHDVLEYRTAGDE